jgi:4-hydroxy-tetrahydrodipicolinate synthase
MPLASNALRGSITPLITPFKNGAVNYDEYAALVERHIAEGGHGVLVNGTSAEPSTLSVAERNQLVDVAVRTARGRTQIVAATGSQSHAETVALTEHAARVGVDALLIVTPYYIRPPQRGLVEYFVDLGKRTDLPLLIYHIPGRAAVSIDADTLCRIRDRAPTLTGMKHAAQELGLVTEALKRLGPEFRIFVGLEELSFPMLALGACGLMNAVGNLVPKRIAALYETVARGDLRGAREQHDALFDLNRAVFFDTNPIPIKYMAKRLGIIERNEHRLPMVPATPELERRLDAVLEQAGLISGRQTANA